MTAPAVVSSDAEDQAAQGLLALLKTKAKKNH